MERKMEREEKIKIAITAGITAIVILILVLFLALSGKKESGDEEKLAENIAKYTESAIVPETLTESSAETGNVPEDKTAGETTEKNSDMTSADKSESGKTTLTEGSKKNTAANSISGNSFYETRAAILKDVYKNVKFNRNQQLAEMHSYWSQGNMEAVRDLAHLERFEAMSYSLSGTMDYYYYGETNSEGVPNGMGLAVYAEDQYYYGQWVNGARSGDGCWISFYPSYSNYVVKEHMFTGQWAGDLPNGQGQEHYDYDLEKMNSEDVYLQNPTGGFSTGLYNGSMYVITIDNNGDTIEWNGDCENGKWNPVPHSTKDSSGEIPVLTKKEDTERHLYMSEKGASGNGVSDIIHGGSIKN